MTSAKRYFLRRILANLAFQWRVLRLVVDWTIAIYVVGPAIAIFFNHYLQYLSEPPAWFSYLSFDMFRALLYLFVLNGTTRYFLEEADQLHFLQGEGWALKFRRWGAIYSAGQSALFTAIVMGFIAPLLLAQFKLSWDTIIGLFVFVWLCKIIRQIFQQLLDVTFVGWKLSLLNMVIYIALGFGFAAGTTLVTDQPTLGWVLCAILLLIIPPAYNLRFRVRGALLQDVRRDAKAKMKYVAIILRNFSMRKKPSYPRRKPLLFRNSRRIFRKRSTENGITEAAIKSLFRSWTRMRLYIIIVFCFILGILFTQLTSAQTFLFTILWCVAGFILSYFVRLQWADFADNPFLGLFAWEPGVLILAMKKYVYITMLPGFLAIGLAVWMPVMSPIEVILMLPVGAFVGYIIASIYSTIASFRMDSRGGIR
ncbi:MAG: ABC transporter permease [Gorillibacterium sp.]|nr:ABC transporter permease [Gorillibacterium sp.]